jgi:hypothetical protein
LEFDQALLDDFAEMTSLARIKNDFAGRRHGKECSSLGEGLQGTQGRRIS